MVALGTKREHMETNYSDSVLKLLNYRLTFDLDSSCRPNCGRRVRHTGPTSEIRTKQLFEFEGWGSWFWSLGEGRGVNPHKKLAQ